MDIRIDHDCTCIVRRCYLTDIAYFPCIGFSIDRNICFLADRQLFDIIFGNSKGNLEGIRILDRKKLSSFYRCLSLHSCHICYNSVKVCCYTGFCFFQLCLCPIFCQLCGFLDDCLLLLLQSGCRILFFCRIILLF